MQEGLDAGELAEMSDARADVLEEERHFPDRLDSHDFDVEIVSEPNFVLVLRLLG